MYLRLAFKPYFQYYAALGQYDQKKAFILVSDPPSPHLFGADPAPVGAVVTALETFWMGLNQK